MGKYNGAVITTAGTNVISQAISGTELTWTVMRSSSVALPEGTDIAALTSLTGIEQTAAITDASVYGNSTIQVSARFSNTGVDTAYLLETIGIYGQLAGGAETLIAVMTAVTPDQMPVYDADSPSAFIYNSQITVQDAETVVMTVNDSGTATVADLNRKVDLNGGDLSNTKGNTFTASTALYPVISAGDTFNVMCGKIAKFCADIIKPFTKATASAAGAKGLVPAPAAGDQIAYLRGDGTWKAPVFSKTTTATGLALDAREANPNVSGSIAADVKALNDSLSGASDSITDLQNNFFHVVSTGAPTGYKGVQVNFDASNVGVSPVLFADSAGNIFILVYNWNNTTDTPVSVTPAWLATGSDGAISAVQVANRSSTTKRIKIIYEQPYIRTSGLLSIDGKINFLSQEFTER